MEIKDEIKQAEKELDKALKKLNALEKEKLDIMERYIDASDDGRKEIQKEMKASEEKYKALSEEVFALGQKIKNLKKQYC